MLKAPMLEGLTEILTKIQRINYKTSLADPTANPIQKLAQNSLNGLEAHSLVNLMEAITAKLDKTSTTSVAEILMYLRPLSALLDVMNIVGVTEVKQKDYDRFYKSIAHFSDHENIRVAFLSHYGKQSFTLIKTNESTSHEVLRRSVHVLKGLAFIGSKISLIEPWAILEAINSDTLDQFKMAFDFHAWKKDWFIHLMILQMNFLSNKAEGLRSFVEKIKQDEAEARKLLPERHHPFFIQGLVDLLQQVIETYGLQDPQLGLVALQLLEKIGRDNYKPLKKAPKTNHLPLFRVKDKLFKSKNYTSQIYQEVRQILSHYTNHPQALIAEAAKQSALHLQGLESSSLPSSKPSDSLSHSPVMSPVFSQTNPQISLAKTVFQSATEHVAPWLLGLQHHKKMLEMDPQVVEEYEFVIALKGKESDADPGDLMAKKLHMALNAKVGDSKNSVVLVLGNPGSGKSLYGKLDSLKELDHFDPKKPLHLYASLPALTNPTHDLMKEILEQNYLLPHREYLQSQEMVLYIDGFDEMYTGARRQQGLDNLYESNYLSQHWPKLQLVIYCRRDFLQPNDYSYFIPSRGSLKQLLVADFKESDIRDYLKQYIAVRQKKDPSRFAPPLLWPTVDQYINYFEKLELGGIICNPFNLKVASDALPAIVERHEEMIRRKKEKGENVKGRILKVAKDDLFNEFICQRIVEEFIRQLRISHPPISDIKEYINFGLELTHEMEICNIQSISPQDKEVLQRNAQLFIEQQQIKIKQVHEAIQANEATPVPHFAQTQEGQKEAKAYKEKQKMDKNKKKQQIQALNALISKAQGAADRLYNKLFGTDSKDVSLRRACFLVRKGNGHTEFMHKTMYEHFRGIRGIGSSKKSIEERLIELIKKQKVL